MDPEGIMPSALSQTEKGGYCILSLYVRAKKETEWEVTQFPGVGGMGKRGRD